MVVELVAVERFGVRRLSGRYCGDRRLGELALRKTRLYPWKKLAKKAMWVWEAALKGVALVSRGAVKEVGVLVCASEKRLLEDWRPPAEIGVLACEQEQAARNLRVDRCLSWKTAKKDRRGFTNGK